MKYYKRNCKIKQCTKCQNYDHWTYFCKNKQYCAHYAQKHRFAKCFHQKNATKWRCDFCKKLHKTFDHQCFKKQAKKRRIKNVIKTKFMFHAMRTKSALTTMIFSFISALKSTITWIKKNTKRKVDRSSKKRCFNKFAAFDQERKNNMN